MGIRDFVKNVHEKVALRGYKPTDDLSAAEVKVLADMARQGQQQLAEGQAFGNNRPTDDIQRRIASDAQSGKLKLHAPSSEEIYGPRPRQRAPRGRRGSLSAEQRRNRSAAEREHMQQSFEKGIDALREGTSNELNQSDRTVLNLGMGNYAESRYLKALQEAGSKKTDVNKHNASSAEQNGTKRGAPYSKEDAHGMAIIENTLRNALAGQKFGGEKPSSGQAPATPAIAGKSSTPTR